MVAEYVLNPESDHNLRDYQVEAVELCLRRKGRAGLWMEMSTGKTRVALEVVNRLFCQRILVVCPLSVPGVWRREVSIFCPDVTVVPCYYGSVKERAARLAGVPRDGRVLVTVNYEGYWREPLRTAINKWKPDIVIYDEAHRLAGRSSRQSNAAHVLTKTVNYALALTGTPMPNGPEDLYSLMKAVDTSVFGTRWKDFSDRYIEWGGFRPPGALVPVQIVGYKNRAELEAKVKETSYRITKDEALQLPDRVDVEVPVELKDRAVYDRLKKHAIAEVESIYRERGTALAGIVLTSLLRLQQITSGFVKTEDGQILDLSTEKLDTTYDLISDALPSCKQVVVFCRYTRDVERCVEKLAPLGHVLRLDGTTPPRSREALIEEFRRGQNHILVCQIDVASLGIDLSSCHVAIFYSLDFKLINWLQSRDRLHRVGQREKVVYYTLVVPKSVDVKIYKALAAKEDLSKSILDLPRARELFSD
jgi:SNF2 family DNA or RNA helicase